MADASLGHTVIAIGFGSEEYEQSLELRRRWLREPLGLRLTAEDVAGEETQHHFALIESGPGPEDPSKVVGGAIGKPAPELGEGCVRLRQVVIAPNRRSRGLGKRLMGGVERRLVGLGYTRAVLYARDEAAPFYERCGYSPAEERVTLLGLDHLRMEKPLPR